MTVIACLMQSPCILFEIGIWYSTVSQPFAMTIGAIPVPLQRCREYGHVTYLLKHLSKLLKSSICIVIDAMRACEIDNTENVTDNKWFSSANN